MDMWKILALSCVVTAGAPTQELEETGKKDAWHLVNDKNIREVGLPQGRITEPTAPFFESASDPREIQTEGDYAKPRRGGSDPLYNRKPSIDADPAPANPYTQKDGQGAPQDVDDKPIKQEGSEQISSDDSSRKLGAELGNEYTYAVLPDGTMPTGGTPDRQKICEFCDTVTALRIWNVIAEGGSVSDELEQELCSVLYTSYDKKDTQRAAGALLYAAWQEGRTVAPYTWALLQLCYTEVVAEEQSPIAQKDAALGLLQQMAQPDGIIEEMLGRLAER